MDSCSAQNHLIRSERCETEAASDLFKQSLESCRTLHGWSNIQIPDKQTLISDAGKLAYLDGLLARLKSQNHRVLIYSQMTRVIDLLEVSVKYFFFCFVLSVN